jgi:hypothetical protein
MTCERHRHCHPVRPSTCDDNGVSPSPCPSTHDDDMASPLSCSHPPRPSVCDDDSGTSSVPPHTTTTTHPHVVVTHLSSLLLDGDTASPSPRPVLVRPSTHNDNVSPSHRRHPPLVSPTRRRCRLALASFLHIQRRRCFALRVTSPSPTSSVPPTCDDDASPSHVVMTRHPPLVPPHSTATAPHPRVVLTHLVRLSTCDDNHAGMRKR